MSEFQHFGNLELRVLGAIDLTPEASVSDLQEYLNKSGGLLAYTTVMTICSRLVAKGVLVRKKKGRKYFYSVEAKFSKMRIKYIKGILDSLFPKDRLTPLLSLIEGGAAMSRIELMALRDAIEVRLAKAK